ncbi:MAG: hypothetical protein IKY42_09035, partial [Bacteroidaceae bacterium]|nr:hypothetical protein [Bacteroidaceae bacterium]
GSLSGAPLEGFLTSQTRTIFKKRSMKKKSQEKFPTNIERIQKVINNFSYNLKTNKIGHFIGDYHT